MAWLAKIEHIYATTPYIGTAMSRISILIVKVIKLYINVLLM